MSSSFSFYSRVVAAGVALLAVLFGALVLSGIVDIRNSPIQRLFGRGDITDLLDKKVKFTDGISEENRTIALQNIEKAKEMIRANPEHPEGWLDLAIFYKFVGDIDSAVEIWKHFADDKNDLLSTQNLANTYHLDLRDYEKSEEYYRKALVLEPRNVSAYSGLHELYRYSYKQDTSAAVDILREGLEQVDAEGRTTLYLALAAYYHEKGEKGLAIKAYQNARVIAVDLGNAPLIRQIDEGLRFLRTQ